jgi:hypothetical protein
LSRNYLKMKDKGLLVFDKKRDFQSEIPSGGAGGIRTLVQTWYKVGFLHAYLLLVCRSAEGQPITYTTPVGTVSRLFIVP